MTPLEFIFPNLAAGGCRVTSPVHPRYNCIAWSAGEDHRWWWPDPLGLAHWPLGVSRDESLPTFAAAYATLGYAPTTDASLEPATEKVALYSRGGVPTHGCRQLPNGRWTSKLGEAEDIEHALDGLTGAICGDVVPILKRPVV